MLKPFKRIVLILLFLLLMVIGFVLYVSTRTHEVPLLPEVQLIVSNTVVPEKEELLNNAAVALYGIDAPKDMDYMDFGVQVMQHKQKSIINDITDRSLGELESIRQFPKKLAGNRDRVYLDLNIADEERYEQYQFPCEKLKEQGCIDKFLADRAVIEKLIAKNETLLERYAQIVKMELYDAKESDSMLDLPMPYVSLLGGSRLRMAQAIFALEDGQEDVAYAILTEELNFTKTLLRSELIYFEYSVVNHKLMSFYQTLSGIMNEPQWFKLWTEEQWLALLQPLGEYEQQSVYRSVQAERKWSVIVGHSIAGCWGEYDDIKSLCWLIDRDFEQNINANLAFLNYERVVKFAQLPLEESAHMIMQGKAGNWGEEYRVDIKKRQQEYLQQGGVFLNLIGRFIRSDHFTDEQSFDWLTRMLKRDYDANAYMQMVAVQYALISEEVEEVGVRDFLLSLGAQGKNPFTQDVLEWSSERQELSTYSFRTGCSDPLEFPLHVALKPSTAFAIQ